MLVSGGPYCPVELGGVVEGGAVRFSGDEPGPDPSITRVWDAV